MASSSCALLLSPLAFPDISSKSLPHHHHLLLPHRHQGRRRHSLQLVRGQNRPGGGDSADPPDRLISAACYLYPFLDGVHFGRFLLSQFPPIQLVILPLTPAIRLFRASPLNPFLIFLTLYFAVVRNPSSFSRYVRFNTMQAIILDVVLIFPDLIERTFAPRDGIGLDIVMSIDSTVFLFLLVSLMYGSASCILGQVPRLPIVAEAADKQDVYSVDNPAFQRMMCKVSRSSSEDTIQTLKDQGMLKEEYQNITYPEVYPGFADFGLSDNEMPQTGDPSTEREDPAALSASSSSSSGGSARGSASSSSGTYSSASSSSLSDKPGKKKNRR